MGHFGFTPEIFLIIFPLIQVITVVFTIGFAGVNVEVLVVVLGVGAGNGVTTGGC